jgi:hypothetical protein
MADKTDGGKGSDAGERPWATILIAFLVLS